MTAVLDKPPALKENFTSTGAKILAHQETLRLLRDGKGRPVVSHIMPTDVCQDRCAFCSVQQRAGLTLPFDEICGYLDIMVELGCRAIILSGGGNPCLYLCPKTKKNISDVIFAITDRGLECGMICNGMKLREYVPDYGTHGNHQCNRCGKQTDSHSEECKESRRKGTRKSYVTLTPEACDRLLWLRVSMSGIDHERGIVEIPDIDPTKTTLGLSWVMHDQYRCEEEPHHKQVSTVHDLIRHAQIKGPEDVAARKIDGAARLPVVEQQLREYIDRYDPKYIRLLPNCLEPHLIAERCVQLQELANRVNPDVIFCQEKPPSAPRNCWLGYVHPVLNCDGKIFPCDSCVLNEEAGHSFNERWSVCHWRDIKQIYDAPIRSLIKNPAQQCPGCVFSGSNALLERIVNGEQFDVPAGPIEHVNFV